MALTPKQRKFVAEYLKDGNGTQAAIRAGYSPKTAGSQAFDLLKKPEIKKAVEGTLEKLEITAESVLEGIRRLAFFDPADFYTEGGALKNIHDIPKEARMALAGFEVEELFDGHGEERLQVGNTVKVRWLDRARSLELLGKHLKLFTDKVEHSVDKTLEQILRGDE